MKPKRNTASPAQQRKMRAGINREIRRYQKGRGLVQNLPADLVAAGVRLFKSEAALACWLCEPARGLGGRLPMVVAQTSRGADRVTELIQAISHGVYL